MPTLRLLQEKLKAEKADKSSKRMKKEPDEETMDAGSLPLQPDSTFVYHYYSIHGLQIMGLMYVQPGGR
jgi:hypothetical protein